FSINGTVCGSPMPLSGGVAGLTAAFYRIGTNLVAATYVPDGNYGYTLSGGERWDLGGGTVVGSTAAFTYGKKNSLQSSMETDYYAPRTNAPYELISDNYSRDTGTEEVKWSMLGAVELAHEDDSSIGLTLLRNRAATDRAAIRIQEHDINGADAWQQRQAIQYTERSLDVMQLTGKRRWDNLFGDTAGLKLDWFGAHNIAEQKEPDVRSFKNVVLPLAPGSGVYIFKQTDLQNLDPAERTLRLWRDTREENSQYGLNLAVPFKQSLPESLGDLITGSSQKESPTRVDGEMKAGLTRDMTRRTYTQNSFYYFFGSQSSPTNPADVDAQQAYSQDDSVSRYSSSNPDALWTDVFMDPDRIGAGPYQNSMRWHVQPNLGDVVYKGEQDFRSGYWMFDAHLTTRLRMSFGERLEGTEITIAPVSDMTNDPQRAFKVPVKTVLPSGGYYYTMAGVPISQASASINESDWLRSVGFVYEVAPNMKVRGTWSQTIARPTFLELAPVITYDFVSGETVVGNKDLKISHI
ncbi:MAG: TonB-dependent receptor, partial [bacterium]